MPAGAIPFPFGDCRICSDKATGVHYGVATCEGCKNLVQPNDTSMVDACIVDGFFKRSIVKGEKYKCFFGRHCVLSPQNRNRCKACRYQRCLQLGMSVEAVKMGRIPKVDKERALEEHRLVEQEKYRHQQQRDVISPLHLHLGGPGPGPHSPDTFYYHLPSPCLTPPNSAGIDGVLRMTSSGIDHVSRFASGIDGSSTDSGVSELDGVIGYDQGLQQTHHRQHDDPQQQHTSGHQTLLTLQQQPQLHHHHHHNNHEQHHQQQLHQQHHQQQQQQQQLGDCPLNSARPESLHPGYLDPRPPSNESVAMDTGRCSLTTHSQHFSPNVIKELITQVIDSGHGRQLQDTVRQLLVTLNTTTVGIASTQSSQHATTPGPSLYRVVPRGGQGDDKAPLAEKGAKRKHETGTCVRHGRLLLQATPSQRFSSSRVSRPQYDTVSSTTDVETKRQRWESYASEAIQRGTHGDGFRTRDEPPNVARLDGPFHAQPRSDQSGIRYVDAHVSGQPSSPLAQFPPDDIPLARTEYAQQRHLQDQLPTEAVKRETESPACQMATIFGSGSGGGGALETLMLNHAIDSAACDPHEFDQYLYPRHDKPHRLHLDCTSHVVDDVLTPESITDGSSSSSSTPSEQHPFTSTFLTNGTVRKTAPPETQLPCLKRATEAHRRHIEDHMVVLAAELTGQAPVPQLNQISRSSRRQVEYMWNQLLTQIPQINTIITGLCHDIPSFSSLPQEDQTVLMEGAYFDIWLIANSSLLRDGESYMRMPCKTRYSRWWMNHFLPTTLVDDIFRCTHALNCLALTPAELVNLCAIQLMLPDRKDLASVSQVRRLYERLLDAFTAEVSRNHPDTPGRILIDVADILTTITSISARLSVVISQFTIDHPPDGCLTFSDDVKEEETFLPEDDDGPLQPKEEVTPVST